MTTIPSYEHLSGAELRIELDRALQTERGAVAITIAVLIEVERRQIYLEDGYPSLYVYCTDHYHLSESDAYHKIQAARACLEWPQIWPALREGALTLKALLLLKPHLTDENCDRLLAQVRYQPTRVAERLVAEIAPRPDRPSKLSAVAPGKYRFEVTVDEETHEYILGARDLLMPAIPDGNLAALTKRAFGDLYHRALRRKAAITDKPRKGRGVADGSRAIPSEVRREVWERDGGRCVFEGARGRCPVSGAVDFHHIIPYAMGGEATVENLELRCRAHNIYQAKKDGLGWKKGDVA